MSVKRTIFEGDRVMVIRYDDWEYVERKKGKEAVAVVAVTDDRRIVLTEQYRRPVDRNVIDLPAGLIGDEEGVDDPGETAKKELDEETGFTCSRVEFLAKGPTSPGITSEIVSLYRAFDLQQKGEGGGVGGEDITVHVIALSALEDWLRQKERAGVLVDLKVWSARRFL